MVNFVHDVLTTDETSLAGLGLSNAELLGARERTDHLSNKVDVALAFVDKLGELTNVADDNNPIGDPAYEAAEYVLKEVDKNNQTALHMESVIELAKEKAAAGQDGLAYLTDHVKSAVEAGPIELTIDTDTIAEDKDTLSAQHDQLEHSDGKLTTNNDTVNAPMITEDRVNKNTLNTEDSIIDPSNTDDDTLEANLAHGIGTNGSAGTNATTGLSNETGPTITDIENITLRGINTVDAYSLKNVTSTAEDDVTTKDVNEGATIVVNIDHNDVAGKGKFVSTTDVEVGAHTVVSNVDGNEIKEVNLIDHTTDMNFAEVGNNAVINLTNGKIDSIGIDAIDEAKLGTEDITINMLDDDDGKLTLGLYDDADVILDKNGVPVTGHNGGGFEEVTLVTSDAAMNVLLAEGTHLYNDDTSTRTVTDADGAGGRDDVLPTTFADLLTALNDANDDLTAAKDARDEDKKDLADAEKALKDDPANNDLKDDVKDAKDALKTTEAGVATATAAVVVAAAAASLADRQLQTPPPAGGQDNLADTLNLAGTKDITITGKDTQLDQAVIRDTLTDDATSTLALEITAHKNVVNLTDAEVDLVKVDASVLERHALGPVTARDRAWVSVDDSTIVEVNKIGDDGVLTITGDAERTDDLEININTNANDANNGRLILGGDDISMSETAGAATAGGDSTESGDAGHPATTQGVDANNAVIHVNQTDSTLDRLDISALLGLVTIDGDKDLHIEDGGLIFDDTTKGFNDVNEFDSQDAASTQGEGETGAGFGGDMVDASAMTGDLSVIIRDGGNAVTSLIIDADLTPMKNNGNGIEMYFGSGDDRVVGLGTAVGPFGEKAGDNVDMGDGRDTVIIGVNDTTTNILPNVTAIADNIHTGGSAQTILNRVANAAEDDDDTTVSDDEKTALTDYNGASVAMAFARINAEVYLDGDFQGNQDHVIFRNQNSGFLAGDNGVRIKDFEAGSDGDVLGFQMFQDGVEDGLPGIKVGAISDRPVTQSDLNLFNNGEVIADTDVGTLGKYIINGADVNGNGLNDSPTVVDIVGAPTPIIGGVFDGANNGANDGNVALISTADIHKFTAESASGLWASNVSGEGVFRDVVNMNLTVSNEGHQYETIILVGEKSTDTDAEAGVKIFYVTDETVPDTAAAAEHNLIDGVPTASLVGLLEGVFIDQLDSDNFDFI